MIAVENLVCHFGGGRNLLGSAKPVVRAVDGVSFQIPKGSTLGIVGESGCGKSTTAKLLMGILAPTSGQIMFDGELLGSAVLPLREYFGQAQMVFQDSYASLNPRLPVVDTIAFGPRASGVPSRDARRRAEDLLARVGLEPRLFGGRYPHELSGGQRQRVNIARALALEPRLLVLDEAVSALDKSVEAQVINLLLDLKRDLNLTYVFISHDLGVVRFVSDAVMVMYLGKIVEIGPTKDIFRAPQHPYTRALLSSMPSMDPDRRTETPPLTGDPPNPINPPSGCRFHPRCGIAQGRCKSEEPRLERTSAGALSQVACHVAQGHKP